MDTPREQEDNASIASGDSTAVYTPTHTTEQDIVLLDDPSNARGSFGSAPAPGRTYMICEQRSGMLLSLQNGHLELRSAPQSGSHWTCMEGLGWFGFVETVSGNFLGRDGNFGFEPRPNCIYHGNGS
ncbi:hypothetical protein F5Y09DRAFT_347723 [Xylaria sp. FL1042]|nr:hypothetical protein F5Y09DRAFT_347723 [Xylaria sp. FL1042]